MTDNLFVTSPATSSPKLDQPLPAHIDARRLLAFPGNGLGSTTEGKPAEGRRGSHYKPGQDGIERAQGTHYVA